MTQLDAASPSGVTEATSLASSPEVLENPTSKSDLANVKRSARLANAPRPHLAPNHKSCSTSQREASTVTSRSSAEQAMLSDEIDHVLDDDEDVELVNAPADEDSVIGSKERSREKNKVAAAKCRAKKRENMGVIESNHRTLSAENSYLRRHEQHLRATVAQLRTLALDHQHCNCGVHQYNIIQAGNLARGLGNFHTQHFGMEKCTGPGPEGGDAEPCRPGSQDRMSPMFQDISHLDMPMDIEHDALFDMQSQIDPFFYDLDGSSDYARGA